jgi:hypothetical protein
MAHGLNDEAETLLVGDDDEAIRKLEARILVSIRAVCDRVPALSPVSEVLAS